jgi:hypothetical protein
MKTTNHGNSCYNICKMRNIIYNFIKNISRFFDRRKKCKCGKYNRCCIKVHSNSNGRIWFETKEYFNCGITHERILSMKKWRDTNYPISNVEIHNRD